MKKFISKQSLAAFSCLLLVACETTQTKPEEPPPKPKEVKPVKIVTPPVEVPPALPANYVETAVLKEGIALYNNGNYGEAIKKLNSPEIWQNGKDKAVQIDAAKFMAFSYCVTSRALLCRQQFERALKLDPNFDLAAGEKGHPLWGPVFLKAKKGK
jgi:hypothetical protein